LLEGDEYLIISGSVKCSDGSRTERCIQGANGDHRFSGKGDSRYYLIFVSEVWSWLSERHAINRGVDEGTGRKGKSVSCVQGFRSIDCLRRRGHIKN